VPERKHRYAAAFNDESEGCVLLSETGSALFFSSRLSLSHYERRGLLVPREEIFTRILLSADGALGILAENGLDSAASVYDIGSRVEASIFNVARLLGCQHSKISWHEPQTRA
jgi:hypothetical protein